MKDIRQFSTGELFGIKVIDNTVRTGVKVATLGRYDSARHGFVVNFISSEGVMGSNQVMRFQNEAAARRWISQNAEAFGYDPDRMHIMRTVGTNRFWKVPVAGYDTPAWVHVRKFDYFSDRQMERLERELPEYFGDGAESDDNQNQVANYRGFRF